MTPPRASRSRPRLPADISSGRPDVLVQPDVFVVRIAGTSSSNYAQLTGEREGMSAFALEDGVVYHTYSTYARGVDGLWGMYQWLDRAPKGRNETGPWFRCHDEYKG
jgi:predicted dithiol-disulfide oxidoreductase (DUF899 family)